MSSVRKISDLSTRDLAEKNLILEAYWKKCIEKFDREGVEYLKAELRKYMASRLSTSHLQLEESINSIKQGMTCDAFKQALHWITPLEAKLIDLFENLKVIDQIERAASKESAYKVHPKDLEVISAHLDEMKMSVSMSIGNANDRESYSVRSFDIPYLSSFATHSVTKIFTGVLAIIMLEKGLFSEKMLKQPIKDLINDKAWKLLPSQVRSHLQDNNVTLYQTMIHRGGLGDYYNNECGYRKALEKKDSPIPKIDHVEDFLPFAEHKVYKTDEEHYSNLGITLVGLAIEEVYKRANLKNKLDFDGILYEYLLKPAGIERVDFSKIMPHNGRFNKSDVIAQYWVGGPAGGYWATPETLEQFGRWLYQECTTNPDFMLLIKKFGQEFYKEDRNVIEHAGTFNSASAFFYLSLTTGNMLMILSDQPLIAPILMSTIRRSMFYDVTDKQLAKIDAFKMHPRDTTATLIMYGLASGDLSSEQTQQAAHKLKEKSAISKKRYELDVTDKAMAKSTFGQGSHTARKLRK